MEALFPGPNNSNLYKRFISVPRRLSNLLGILTFSSLFMYGQLFLFNAHLNVLLGAIVSAVIGIISAVVSIELTVFAKHVMMRQRMWIWGKNHFNSWDELWDFWYRTDCNELERIAGLKDDEW